MEDEEELEILDSIELDDDEVLKDNEIVALPALAAQETPSFSEHTLQSYLRKVNNIPSLTKEEEFKGLDEHNPLYFKVQDLQVVKPSK